MHHQPLPYTPLQVLREQATLAPDVINGINALLAEKFDCISRSAQLARDPLRKILGKHADDPRIVGMIIAAFTIRGWVVQSRNADFGASFTGLEFEPRVWPPH